MDAPEPRARPLAEESQLAMVDRMRDESGEKPEDAARRLQHVKKALARARVAITDEKLAEEPLAASKHLAGLAREMGLDYACLAIVANWAAGAGPDPNEVITLQEVLDNVAAASSGLPGLIASLLARQTAE